MNQLKNKAHQTCMLCEEVFLISSSLKLTMDFKVPHFIVSFIELTGQSEVKTKYMSETSGM